MHLRKCCVRSRKAQLEIYSDFSSLYDWMTLEIKEPVTPIIVDKKLEMEPVKKSLFWFRIGILLNVLSNINKAIKTFIKFSSIDNEKIPPNGTPIRQPNEKGIITFHFTLNLKNISLLKFEPSCMIAWRGIITLPEKFSARTPNRSIPPPNPIIDEIKEDTKLVKIIDIMESIEILSGK